jgi:hypothetical protein
MQERTYCILTINELSQSMKFLISRSSNEFHQQYRSPPFESAFIFRRGERRGSQHQCPRKALLDQEREQQFHGFGHGRAFTPIRWPSKRCKYSRPRRNCFLQSFFIIELAFDYGDVWVGFYLFGYLGRVPYIEGNGVWWGSCEGEVDKFDSCLAWGFVSELDIYSLRMKLTRGDLGCKMDEGKELTCCA